MGLKKATASWHTEESMWISERLKYVQVKVSGTLVVEIQADHSLQTIWEMENGVLLGSQALESTAEGLTFQEFIHELINILVGYKSRYEDLRSLWLKNTSIKT